MGVQCLCVCALCFRVVWRVVFNTPVCSSPSKTYSSFRAIIGPYKNRLWGVKVRFGGLEGQRDQG